MSSTKTNLGAKFGYAMILEIVQALCPFVLILEM